VTSLHLRHRHHVADGHARIGASERTADRATVLSARVSFIDFSDRLSA
jgi:hypothetical protein